MRRLILIVIFFLSISAFPVSAQTITIPMPTGNATPSAGPSPVNYELPYPGMLPGSPLYLVKEFRDKVSEMFTMDPLKKSNLYLLRADKKLAASIMLYENENPKLGEETLSKGLNYLEKSFEKMKIAKDSQENTMDIYAKIKSSSAKQKEQILIIQKNAKGEDAEKLKHLYKRAEEIQNNVDTYSP